MFKRMTILISVLYYDVMFLTYLASEPSNLIFCVTVSGRIVIDYFTICNVMLQLYMFVAASDECCRGKTTYSILVCRVSYSIQMITWLVIGSCSNKHLRDYAKNCGI